MTTSTPTLGACLPVPADVFESRKSDPLRWPCFIEGFNFARRPDCNAPCCIEPGSPQDGDSPKYLKRQLEAELLAEAEHVPGVDNEEYTYSDLVLEDDEDILVKDLVHAAPSSPAPKFTHNVHSGITPPHCSKEGIAVLRMAMKHEGVDGWDSEHPIQL